MRRGALALLLALAAGCSRRAPGPDRLLLHRTAEGGPPRAGALATGGEARPALLRSASFDVRLPSRALLTFGMGVAFTGKPEDAPDWYRLKVRAGDQVLLEHTLNPRAAHGWRDFSVPLERLGRRRPRRRRHEPRLQPPRADPSRAPPSGGLCHARRDQPPLRVGRLRPRRRLRPTRLPPGPEGHRRRQPGRGRARPHRRPAVLPLSPLLRSALALRTSREHAEDLRHALHGPHPRSSPGLLAPRP